MFDGAVDMDTDPPNRAGGVLVLIALAAIAWCVVVLVLMLTIGLARADVQGDPRPITWTNCSTLSITAGGTAQTAVTIGNSAARGFFLQNEDTATTQGIVTAENLYFQPDGTAVAATSPFLPPGASVSFGPGTIFASSLSILGATTGHKYACMIGR